jgi:hypothetical protein
LGFWGFGVIVFGNTLTLLDNTWLVVTTGWFFGITLDYIDWQDIF